MNIVLIIFDSLRQDHVGAYGNKWIKTPHLDKFAKESVVFTHCYPDSLPTIPVRRALHTGARVFPFRDHISVSDARSFNPIPGWGPLPADKMTIGERLKEEGYRTALITDCYHMFKPGFNYHCGFDNYLHIRGQELDLYKKNIPVPDCLVDKHLNDYMRQFPHIAKGLKLFMGNNSFRRSEEDFFAPLVFREASKWLFENQDAERMFMVVDSFDPHEPWDPPEYYRRIYNKNESGANHIQSVYYYWKDALVPEELKILQANYAGEVTMCDRWFGFFLESLNLSGRMDDTIVAVISDHGHNLGYEPADKGMVCKQAYPMTRSVADLVLMIRHPHGVGAGQIRNNFLHNFDLTYTLLSMAGIEQPPSMEGIDVWTSVLDEQRQLRDHVTIGWGHAITVIDDQWWYNAGICREKPLLFNLVSDPHLTENLAYDAPDVCTRMYQLALADAGGDFGDYLNHYNPERGAGSMNGWTGGPFMGGAMNFKEIVPPEFKKHSY